MWTTFGKKYIEVWTQSCGGDTVLVRVRTSAPVPIRLLTKSFLFFPGSVIHDDICTNKIRTNVRKIIEIIFPMGYNG